MRTLIPLVLLAALAYAGWFYLQPYTSGPLRERLLLTDTESLRELSVTNDKQTFRIFRGEDSAWVVKQGATELYDQTALVNELTGLLGRLRTDSVARRFPPEAGPELLLRSEGGGEEALGFRFPAGGPPVVRVAATGDVFALPREVSGPLRGLLSFGAYRGTTTLRISPEEVDSILVYHHDSLLWRVPAATVARCSKAFIAPASAPDYRPAYADYFDEVMDRERYFATLSLHTARDTHRIEVFRDSQWVRPYVLVSEDFPRRYFALDSLR